MSRKSSSERKRKNPALAKPSDLEATGVEERREAADHAGSPPITESVRPGLPPVMKLELGGGEYVTLLEDQEFSDRDRIKKGELGIALYPSSQAASWVVHFPKKGDKLRVIPERLLQPR